MADVHITPNVNPLSGAQYTGMLREIQASPRALSFNWLEGGRLLKVNECIGHTNDGHITLASKDFYIYPTDADFSIFLLVLEGTPNPITLHGVSKDDQRLIREFSESQCKALAQSWQGVLHQYGATPENYKQAFEEYARQNSTETAGQFYDETSIFPLLYSDTVRVGYLGQRIKLNPSAPNSALSPRLIGTDFTLTRAQTRQWSAVGRRDPKTIDRKVANLRGDRHYTVSEQIVTSYASALEVHLRRVYNDILDLGIIVPFNSQPTKMKSNVCEWTSSQCNKMEEQLSERLDAYTTYIGNSIKTQFVGNPLKLRVNFLTEYAEYCFHGNHTKRHSIPTGVIKEYTLSYEDFVAILTNQQCMLTFRNSEDSRAVDVKVTANLTERYYKYVYTYCTQASIDLGFAVI